MFYLRILFYLNFNELEQTLKTLSYVFYAFVYIFKISIASPTLFKSE